MICFIFAGKGIGLKMESLEQRSVKFAENKINSCNKEFEWIYNTYYHPLYLYAKKLIGSMETAEDIVQDIFLTLWVNRGSMHIITSLKSYLYKGIYNNCLKHLEHIKVSSKYSEYTQSIIGNNGLLWVQDNNHPLSVLTSQEAVSKIYDKINALPLQCREVFLLARIEKLSYLEISEKLGISLGTVRTQITRATAKLRKSLEDI